MIDYLITKLSEKKSLFRYRISEKAIIFSLFLSFTIVPVMILSNIPSYTSKFIFLNAKITSEIFGDSLQREIIALEIDKIIPFDISITNNTSTVTLIFNTSTYYRDADIYNNISAYLDFLKKETVDGTSLITKPQLDIYGLYNYFNKTIYPYNITFGNQPGYSGRKILYSTNRSQIHRITVNITHNETLINTIFNCTGHNCAECMLPSENCLYIFIYDKNMDLDSVYNTSLDNSLFIRELSHADPYLINYTISGNTFTLNVSKQSFMDFDLVETVIADYNNIEIKKILPVNITLINSATYSKIQGYLTIRDI